MEGEGIPSVTLTTRLKEQARELGFSLVGVASVEPSAHMDLYREWVEDGRHGEMGYLAREDAVARRADLRRTLPSVRSVVVVGDEYFQEDPPGVPADPARGVIARYARGQDYHGTIKKRLLELHRWVEASEGPVEGRVYVDTGPILERELAVRAGVGWFGKNTMLIHPKRGSYFFLGLLLLDLDLDADAPFQEDHCGTCRSCLDACPTRALLGRDASGAPVMDATRCISYLTIEHRGSIPVELRPLMGNRVYGCDICQEVCPWNRAVHPAGGRGGLSGEGRAGRAVACGVGRQAAEPGRRGVSRAFPRIAHQAGKAGRAAAQRLCSVGQLGGGRGGAGSCEGPRRCGSTGARACGLGVG